MSGHLARLEESRSVPGSWTLYVDDTPQSHVELDRPDWSSARTRHDLPLSAERGAGLVVVPGLLPEEGQVLVLVVDLVRAAAPRPGPVHR